jgi:ABC-type multidrug transport system ATPase subunit
MEDSVRENRAAVIAINWQNSAESDRVTHPKLEVFVQKLSSDPFPDITELLRQSFATVLANSTDGNMSEFAADIRETNWSLQTYPTFPRTENADFGQFATSFCVFPIVLILMPFIQLVLQEKESKVSALSFIMGCPESAYWCAAFLLPFALSLIPYVIVAGCLSFGFALKGNDFSLLLVIFILFVIGHIWFMFVLSTLIRTALGEKLFTITLTVVVMISASISQSSALRPGKAQAITNQATSIVPITALQLTLISQYQHLIATNRTVGWGDLYMDMTYPTAWGLAWLFIDAILYFVLFVILNALKDRKFGSPPLGWRGLFKLEAWRRLFRSEDKTLFRILHAASRMIGVDGMRKVYSEPKDVAALDGIDFAIDPGEVIAVIGANRAGKSTMVNILSGVEDATEGRFGIAGTQSSFRDIQQHIGVVFADNILIPLLSVREQLQLFAAFRGLPASALETAIDMVATSLEIAEVLDTRARDLNAAQQRKLCIALSLLGHPPIILMDEPSAGIDFEARRLIWKTIASIEETTVIVTSRELEEAEVVCSRLFFLSQGKLTRCGTPAQFRRQFKCGYSLRIMKDDGTLDDVVRLAHSFVPEAHVDEDRPDTIALPVVDAVPAFLSALNERQHDLGVREYTVGIERLDDVLLKLVENDEAEFDSHMK